MPKDGRSGKSRGTSKNKPMVGSSEIFALGSKQEEHLRKSSDGGSGGGGASVGPGKGASGGPSVPVAGSGSGSAGSKVKGGKDPRLSAGVVPSGSGLASSSPASAGVLSTASNVEFSRRVDFGLNTSVWEDSAIEVDPVNLVHTVLEASEASDEMSESVLCGAAKQLRASRHGKPDPVLALALMTIVKAEPSVFRMENVEAAFGSLLRPVEAAAGVGVPAALAPGYKTGKSGVAVLAANLLMLSHIESEAWPEEWVSGYVEDSLGERSWVDGEECRGFSRNMVTAFGTRQPSSQSNFADISGEVEVEMDPERLDAVVSNRFKHCKASVASTVTSVIESHLNRRQPWDAVGRHVVKLMISAAGVPAVRLLAAQRLEIWLGNPKLARIAGDLLRAVAANLSPNPGTPGVETDVEVVTLVTRIRPKAKPQLNQYLACIREAVGRGKEIIALILKYVMYNELSQNRNPNNMQIISAVIQTAPEPATTVLAEIFAELLKQEEDFTRALKLLLREIIRALRYDFPFSSFALQLHTGAGGAILRDLRGTPGSKRDRIFHSIGELIALATILAISPSVKEAAMSLAKGEKNKDFSALATYQNDVAVIQRDAVYWIHTRANEIFSPNAFDYMRIMQRIFWLDHSEQFWNMENWPAENERNILVRIASDVPVLEDTLLRIVVVGCSKDIPYKPADALELVEALVRRCAALRTTDPPPLSVENAKLAELLFTMTQYFHPEGSVFPDGYAPPVVAVSNSYWKSWLVLLLVTALNPASFGAAMYDSYPTLTLLVEMCITNQFSWPPSGFLARDKCEEIRVRDVQAAAFEKQRILEYEYYLAGKPVPEETSQLLNTLISLDFRGSPRKPPAAVLAQLRALNVQFKIGNQLCRSRDPDYLLKILERQHPSQALPWLGTLVESCDGAYDMLPIPCLCEFLMNDDGPAAPSPSASDTAVKAHVVAVSAAEGRRQQLVSHLRGLIAPDSRKPKGDDGGDDDDEPEMIDIEAQDKIAENRTRVLDYFFQRLSSERGTVRRQAAKVMNLLLLEEAGEDADQPAGWLIPGLSEASFLQSLLAKLTVAIRQALQVECDVPIVSAYIQFLCDCVINRRTKCKTGVRLSAAGLSDLIPDLATVVVERNIVTESVLKPRPCRRGGGRPRISSAASKTARSTLEAFLYIFAYYFRKLRESRDRQIPESLLDGEGVVVVRWPEGSKRPDLRIPSSVVNAVVVLLTHGPPVGGDPTEFNELCAMWFDPVFRPRLFQTGAEGAGEELPLFPDWLALKMLRCDVDKAVDAALREIRDPAQLTVFFQSFGLPASNFEKLLSAMDAAVEADAAAVEAAVPDGEYFLELLAVQRDKGVRNGWKFEALLKGDDAVREREPMDVSTQSGYDEVVVTEDPKLFPFGDLLSSFELRPGIRPELVQASVMRLFDSDAVVKWTSAEKRAAHASFQTALAADLLPDGGSRRDPAVVKSVLAVFEAALSSSAPEQRRALLDAFQRQEIPAACLFSLLAQTRGKFVDEAVVKTMTRVFHLSRPRPADNVQLSEVLARASDPESISGPGAGGGLARSRSSPFANGGGGTSGAGASAESRTQVTGRIRAALKSCGDAQTEATLEGFVEECMNRNDTGPLVEAMASLLLEETTLQGGCQSASKISILVDMLPILDPELGSTELVRDVLFARRPRDAATRVRPQAYLLSLLTHQASYLTLAETIRALLAPPERRSRTPPVVDYDPTSVLDFLTACVFIPKLWQGRPKSGPKRLKPDDMLGLDVDQLRRLCDYVLEEMSLEGCDQRFLLNRVNLLLRCCRNPDGIQGDDLERLKVLVDKLLALGRDPRLSAAARKLLALVYSKRPLEVAAFVPRRVESVLGSADESSSSFVSGQSPYDGVVHVVVTSLGAATQRGKEWGERIAAYESALRRVASRSPALVLRHLPSLAATLRGRDVTSKFAVFRAQHHLRLFQVALDLLNDALAPAVFRPAYAASVTDICQTFGQVFSTFAVEGGEVLVPLASKFAQFLARYLSADSSRAMRIVVELEPVLQLLASVYTDLRLFDDLLSAARFNSNGARAVAAGEAAVAADRPEDGDAVGCEGKDEAPTGSRDVDIWTPRPDLGSRISDHSEATPSQVKSVLDEIHSHWENDALVLQGLRRLESMASSSTDFSVASRASAGVFLRPALDMLTRLSSRPTSRSVRSHALSLLVDVARSCPADSVPRIVVAVTRCLRPGGDASVADTALKVLPDIAALAPESAPELLARGAFRLALSGSKEAERAINRSLGLLFLVKGAAADPAGPAADRYGDSY